MCEGVNCLLPLHCAISLLNHMPTDGNKKKVQGGCYRNGVRFSEVVEGDQLSGYYDERSVSDGQWLNVAQYEKDLKDKNGRCFEWFAKERVCV